jgi:hypothetical protein
MVIAELGKRIVSPSHRQQRLMRRPITRTYINKHCAPRLLILIVSACLAVQSLAGADNAPSVAQQTLSKGTPAAQNGFAAAAYTNEATAGSSPDGSMGGLRGITRNPNGIPLPAVNVTLHGADRGADKTTISGADGAFSLDGLKPGHYQVTADKEGFATSPAVQVEIAAAQNFSVDLALGAIPSGACPGCGKGSFFGRLVRAYYDDWHPSATSGPEPAYRGYPMPVVNPPFPFGVWPIGGTVWIGYPNATSYPLTTALYGGNKTSWLKKANIQLYGWADVGMNVSTSHDGTYANAPAAYPQVANTFTLDQATLYLERVPDTVQRDHFDWGFRLTNLYGFDYRFTTASGYFSQQLLNNPKADGTIGNRSGYDPVMAYLDLYFPKIGQGWM